MSNEHNIKLLESDMQEIVRICDEMKESDMEQQSIANKTVSSIPYQLCPKCNGQGQTSKPPYVAGDVHQWSSSSCSFPCDVCNGSKIIPMFIVSQDNVKAPQQLNR